MSETTVKKSVVSKTETRKEMLTRAIAQANALVENHPVGMYLEINDSPQGKAVIVEVVLGMFIALQLYHPEAPMWKHRKYINAALDMADDQASSSRIGKELLWPGSSEGGEVPEQECEAYAVLVAGIARTIFDGRLLEEH